MNPYRRDWWWRTPVPVMWQRSVAFMKGRLRASELNTDIPCFFVLSTGRSGTRSLAHLLTKAPAANVFHEPHPHLLALSSLAYVSQYAERATLKRAFLDAREIQLRHAWSCGLTYGETANYNTFLAPIIAEALPRSQFLHVIRDPISFVKSGVARGWYTGHPQDDTRWRPLPTCGQVEGWSTLEPHKKIAWLWRETNTFITSVGEALPPERFKVVRTEDIFSGEPTCAEGLFEFLKLHKPTRSTITRCLEQKWNETDVQDERLNALPSTWLEDVRAITTPS